MGPARSGKTFKKQRWASLSLQRILIPSFELACECGARKLDALRHAGVTGSVEGHRSIHLQTKTQLEAG